MKRLLQLFPLLFLTASTHAATFARVCQDTGQYVARDVDCKGAASAIRERWGDLVVQQGTYSACEIIYASGSCKVELCAFPGQGANTTDVITGLNDILDNCQNTVTTPSASVTFTAGYNIIVGTNSTIGVTSSETPASYRCTVSSSSTAAFKDCQAAINALPKNTNITQNSNSGCSRVSTSGSCFLNYCDVQGSQINSDEYTYAVSGLLFVCNNDAKQAEGFIQMDGPKRIGIFGTGDPSPEVNPTPTCKSYPTSPGGPSQSNCALALKSISSNYGDTVTINQTDSGCMKVAATGNCIIDVCGLNGSQVPVSLISQAFNNINSTCAVPVSGKNANNLGGYTRIAGTGATLSLSPVQIPRNIWCNPAPNNSPLINDCIKLVDQYNTSDIYVQTSESQGCTLMGSYNTCKVNFCSLPGDTITGAQLKSLTVSIAVGCVSGSYTSGIYQMNANTSVGIYDPPFNLTTIGHPTNSTSSYSPNAADCFRAVQQLAQKGASVPCANNDPTGPSSCTKLATVGTCQLQICGNNNNAQTSNPGLQPFYCAEISYYFQYALAQNTISAIYPLNGKVGSIFGLRNAYYGDTVLQIVVGPGGSSSKRDASTVGHPHRRIEKAENDSTTKEIIKRVPPGIQAGNSRFYIQRFALPLGQFISSLSSTALTTLRIRLGNELAQIRGLATLDMMLPGRSEAYEAILMPDIDYLFSTPDGRVDLYNSFTTGSNLGSGSGTNRAIGSIINAIYGDVAANPYPNQQANQMPTTIAYLIYDSAYSATQAIAQFTTNFDFIAQQSNR